MNTPLSERMRPDSLDMYFGQEKLVGQGSLLQKAIKSGQVPSFILWGPPGVGKTTLANIIAKTSERPFYILSAISAGVKDVREVIKKANSSQFFGRNNPILFIDEIHRFSKSQQDALLGAVEKGIFTLIGATTENPSFEVIPALLSRCQVFILNALNKDQLIALVDNALKTDVILKRKNIKIKQYEALLRYSGGDARRLYNLLETLCIGEGEIVINNEMIEVYLETNIAKYDKGGDQHYDIISAFIKSIRGSDPNGAIYWLARMLIGGEDPKFIARRLLILAAEDVGLANPNALLLANTTMDAVMKIGMPESRIILSELVIYLALSAKSNSAYMAIGKAYDLVKKNDEFAVPLHLRNAPTQLMKELNYGKNYKYAHNYENNIADEEFLPKDLIGTKIFEPANQNKERHYIDFLKKYWKKYKY